MTVELFTKLVQKYNISPDCKMMSDSGWECNETEMDGTYYSREANQIIFTQNLYGDCQGIEYGDHTYEQLYLDEEDLKRRCR